MRYMAPEVCLDQEYNCYCDIYSYGIVCWELWTHCIPYEELTPELYEDWVCLRGYRPTTNMHQNMNHHAVHNDNNVHCNSNIQPLLPNEVSALLSQAWKHNPSSRIGWSKIQNQFKLFKQLEELQFEEHELFYNNTYNAGTGGPSASVSHSSSSSNNMDNSGGGGGGNSGQQR
mmetsp:Transcript_15182/g.17055  ORF Transcript_15182/g.17055 Transcript_15182/m.17055 type:complete len:173 (+) Transcript_15182:354-872(+)